MDVECFFGEYLERKMKVNKKLVRKKEKKLPIFESFSKNSPKIRKIDAKKVCLSSGSNVGSPLVNYVRNNVIFHPRNDMQVNARRPKFFNLFLFPSPFPKSKTFLKYKWKQSTRQTSYQTF